MRQNYIVLKSDCELTIPFSDSTITATLASIDQLALALTIYI